MENVLVTGGNRGIGLEICKQLDDLGYRVILTSRKIEKGLLAAKKLSKNVVVRQLDITDEESIKTLFLDIESNLGDLGILINNAGLGSDNQERNLLSVLKSGIKRKFHKSYQIIKSFAPILQSAKIETKTRSVGNVNISDVKTMMETNFYGAWRMIQVFQPLLLKSSPKGRIINISSGMGGIATIDSDYPAYRLSKLSLNVLTQMYAKELKEDGINVNSICPGWVRTDMGGPDAPKSVKEGVETIMWLINENPDETGKFFKDRKVISW